MAKLELHMTLDELKRRYTESAEKPETMIDILADLNDTESTFIAYLLHHMDCTVPQVKMPRSPRSQGAPSKDVEYRATAVWEELKKKASWKDRCSERINPRTSPRRNQPPHLCRKLSASGSHTCVISTARQSCLTKTLMCFVSYKPSFNYNTLLHRRR